MPAYGAGNLLQMSPGAKKVIRYSAFSSTVGASLTSEPGTTPLGMSVDQNLNLYSVDQGGTKHTWKFSNFTTTIKSSFVSPATTPTDVTWDNNRLYTGDQGGSLKLFKHSAFTSTVLASFAYAASNEPFGVSLDGTFFYVMDQGSGGKKLRKHSLFTSTIIDSFSSLTTLPRAIGWDGNGTTGNVLQSNITSTKNAKNSAFTSTIKASFTGAVGSDNYSMEWDDFYGANTQSTNWTQTLTETLALTDSILKQDSRTLSETLSLTDTLSAIKIINLTLTTEVLALTDSIVKTATKVLTETLTLTDSIIRTVSRTLSETLTLTDSFGRLFGKVLSETLSLTATIFKYVNGNLITTIWSFITKNTATWTNRNQSSSGIWTNRDKS